jgi:hypothetical protein
MAITGEDLLENIGVLLFDENGDTWDDDLKVSLVNEALGLIVLARPDASAVTEAFTVTQDTPKQTIPASGIRFLDIIMNTAGAPIRKTTREELNDTVPAWTTTTGTAIETYAFDEENPKTFWVQPVPASALSIELVYSDTIDTFTIDSSTVGVSDIYISTIKDYVMGRCYGMPTSGTDLGKSAKHMTMFYKNLGMKLESDIVLKQVQES